MEWGNKVSKKYVSKDMAEQIREKAKPFLAWLAEAEEESSEEDEDEIEVSCDDRMLRVQCSCLHLMGQSNQLISRSTFQNRPKLQW